MLHPRLGFALLLSTVLAAGAPALAQEASTAEQTIDVMNTLFGKHPGARANHAKGVVAEGSFTPSPEAARISKASLFKGPAVPVTIRRHGELGGNGGGNGGASGGTEGGRGCISNVATCCWT